MVHRRLSAGQQRRLALAVALARDPRLLLLDEPHAGLDAAGRELLDSVIAAAPAEGRSVVLASHELSRARALAQREVRVVAGRCVSANPRAAGATGHASRIPSSGAQALA